MLLSELSNLPAKKRLAAYRDFVAYSFRVLSYSDMVKRYPSTMVQTLARDGELLYEGKSYVYNRACGHPLTSADYALPAESKKILRSAVDSCSELRRKLEALRAGKYVALLPEDLRDLTGRVLSSKVFTSYLERFSFKKMSFLVATYGVKHEDLISEMKLASCYAILRAYPCYMNTLHVLNIAKTAAHNRGINLIHEYTASSRNRLTTVVTAGNGPSYHATTFSLEELSTNTNTNVLVLGHENLVVNPAEKLIDTTLAFTQLEEKLPPKKKALLHLLRGEPDEHFSVYLGEDNDDFADRVPYDLLLKKVCVFLNLKEEHAKSWLRSLRSVL